MNTTAPTLTSTFGARAESSLTDAELLAGIESSFDSIRMLQATLLHQVAELSSRSRSELGAEGLARRTGASNPADLLAHLGRTTSAHAKQLVRVADATAPRLSLAGEHLPAACETLAAALDAGAVSVDAAGHMVTQLGLARVNANLDDLEAAETELVAFAAGQASAEEVRTLAVAWCAALDPDGVEPREEALVKARALKRYMLPNGLKRYQWDLDPLSAATADAVVDAEIAAAIRKVRFAGNDHDDPDAPDGGAPPIEDPRSFEQIGADVLVDVFRHSLSCENTTPALAATTVIVRIPLEALRTGDGAAEIDGCEQLISASTARKLAVDADIIPVVLGGKSEVLDLGHRRRLFTRAQKLALYERDGGCIEGCNRPAVYLDGHHIEWWSKDHGATDLGNGVLTCGKVHRLIHNHGWEIHTIDGQPALVPPASVDPHRRPRRRPPSPARARQSRRHSGAGGWIDED